jgi:CheY-like chemotaxis protein
VEARRVGDDVQLRVIDNGAGIPPEMLESIFDLFTQVPGSLNRAPGGLGIGLTLVRTLVELHGGKVQASSAGRGRGSTFTVSLPALEQPAGRVAEVASTGAAMVAGGRRVLVVDDNVDAAESLAEVLRLMGHVVGVAPDAGTALRLSEDEGARPEVVLLDIGLPGMDGYETAREWRRRFGHASRLVALTGYGSAEDRRRTAEAGFDAHLTKPVSIEEVAAVMDLSAGARAVST